MQRAHVLLKGIFDVVCAKGQGGSDGILSPDGWVSMVEVCGLLQPQDTSGGKKGSGMERRLPAVDVKLIFERVKVGKRKGLSEFCPIRLQLRHVSVIGVVRTICVQW
jgi:hypothetical protein